MNKFSIQYDQERYTESQNNLVDQALVLAVTAHDGQLRASGEPYVIHPIAVAEQVAKWGLDHEAVMAALLHDVVEDTDVTVVELTERFGPKVAELVDGVTKLRLSTSPRPAATSPRLETSNENLRKLLLATTKDYRVMLIKLADRLHNMRTLGYLPAEKREQIARESLAIYAPLADRLGMGQLKGELEDLGFQYSRPEEYAELEKQVRVTARRAERYLAVLKRAVSEHLAAGGVELVTIEARQKHHYSIYKKLAKVEGDIEKIYDLIAVRLIVPDVAACYQALGILHQHYKPLIYRIKDYIAVPKPNGYQSLHTTVFGENGRITEIQIRTPQMHQEAEYGLAAHFFYDQQKLAKGYAEGKVSKLPDSLRWVTELSALRTTNGDGQEFVDGAKLELFAGRIFVFSPKGDLYDFPEGATPLDFAFGVHSAVGLRALGARVNGRMVPLDSRLENRDVVEIVTRREAAPSRDWMSSVVTSQAKSKLRAWFRAASRETNMATGRALLEGALVAWEVRRLEDLPKRVVSEAVDALHVRSLDDILVQLAEGTLSLTQVIRRLFPDAARPASITIVKRTEPTGRILVEGSQLPYTLAPCCNPVFPQPLLGYVTRGKGVTVHALGCRNLPTDVERYTSCRWETTVETPERLRCQVEVRAINRIGLISDITGLIAAQRLHIEGLATRQREETDQSVVAFGLEVPDLFVLAGVIRQIERLPGVLEVTRVD
ncbi:MAG: (p)ppGpp synthetase SpoT/RelA [Patescibacteria group bacterium]|nr:(p)ppGpp synthetase SpoT/RelA [Patescibacteria group bacterium]